MSYIAQVVDGKVVESTTQESLSSSKKSSGNTLDKEAFLQLLVAQMKYQDPMEPTSNTESVSQYAQFAQVETMQNMSANMDLQRATSLVGQEVHIKTTGASGETTLLTGRVDYVIYENGTPYLVVNEGMYALDDLYTVSDKEYITAYDKATELVEGINKLPVLNAITVSTDGEKIDELNEMYQNMSDYEKTFVAKEKVTALQEYVDRLAVLRKNEQPETPETPEEPTEPQE
ncbi:MAG: flagellar hook capping protein [Lachnospiraceae bacterium]|nr:flagellar hook capping protein [Lachnospiraceae bacterium]